MDEVTWLTTTNQRTWMLEYLRSKPSPRRLRLFACACVRRFWEHLPDESREAVEIAERVAERLAAPSELARAAELAAAAPHETRNARLLRAATFTAMSVPEQSVHAATNALAAVPREDWREELAAQCDLIRCIFGNPFRPVVIPPSLREATAVRQIAQVIAEERRWSDMPILADALEDAGCVDEILLAHCRGGGAHGSGCWVVDQILGRGP